jgi:hypothetical protein
MNLGSAARTVTTVRRHFLSQERKRVLRKVIALVSHAEMTNAYRGVERFRFRLHLALRPISGLSENCC